MGIAETLVFYLVIGLAVAVAVRSQDEERPPLERSYRAATAVVFWPVYLPILLSPAAAATERQRESSEAPVDELARRIEEVDRELDAAFSSLDGWAEQALSHARSRTDELRAAWNWQAGRIRAMDEVLRGCPATAGTDDSPDTAAVAGDRIHRSEQSRKQNLARLRAARDRAYEDLTATLARVRELISLIHLAKFTGAPASRADELVHEIAASVEGLSEVATWRDPPGESTGPTLPRVQTEGTAVPRESKAVVGGNGVGKELYNARPWVLIEDDIECQRCQ